MNMEECSEALAEINAKVDALKEEARVLVRTRDRLIAEAKIAAMPDAEKAALLALMKGA